MNNFSNIDKAKLQAMLNAAASGSGIDVNKLSGAVNSGNLDSVLGTLGTAKASEMKKLLNNKQALQELLNSPEAQNLINQLSK